jgi:predicted metal-binding membrane protein
MLQLRAAAGCLWWRPSACRAERAVTAVLVSAIAAAWVVLAVLAVAGSSGSASTSGPVPTGASGLQGLSAARGTDGMGDMPDLSHLGTVQGMSGMGGAGMSGMAGMGGMAGIGGAHTSGAHRSMLLGMGLASGMVLWALMVLAMMLPTALPAIRHVAVNSLRRRRGRAMATFAAVYVVIWVAVGAVLVAAAPAWSALSGTWVAAAVLAVAAGWQLTVHKRRALRDCHRPSPLPPTGSRATAGVIRFALRNSTACVRSCWAMMLAMAVATTATTFWMVAITGLALTEKLALKPRQAIRSGAVLLGAGALLVAAGALI